MSFFPRILTPRPLRRISRLTYTEEINGEEYEPRHFTIPSSFETLQVGLSTSNDIVLPGEAKLAIKGGTFLLIKHDRKRYGVILMPKRSGGGKVFLVRGGHETPLVPGAFTRIAKNDIVLVKKGRLLKIKFAFS